MYTFTCLHVYIIAFIYIYIYHTHSYLYKYIYIHTCIHNILLLHSYSGRSCVSCMDGVMTYVWSMFSLLNGFSTVMCWGLSKLQSPMKYGWKIHGLVDIVRWKATKTSGLYIVRGQKVTGKWQRCLSFFLKKIRHLVGEEQIWKVVSFLLSASWMQDFSTSVFFDGIY